MLYFPSVKTLCLHAVYVLTTVIIFNTQYHFELGSKASLNSFKSRESFSQI